MKVVDGYIYLRNLKFHAYHGVLPQERATGNDYVVNLRVGYPLQDAMQSDAVDDTLNYAEVFQIVKAEMKRPHALIERVAASIVEALEKAFPAIQSIDIDIQKCNPPMGADGDGAGVALHLKREQS